MSTLMKYSDITARVQLKILWILLMLILAFPGGAASAQIDATWDGGAGTTLWSGANNWNPDGIPNNGANFYNVTVGRGYTVDMSSTTIIPHPWSQGNSPLLP